MAVSPRSTSVGLAGLGNLGLPLATTLVRAGWDLAVLDSVPERAEPAVALGAKAVPNVRGLAGERSAVEQGPGGGGAGRAGRRRAGAARRLAQTMAARVEAHAHA